MQRQQPGVPPPTMNGGRSRDPRLIAAGRARSVPGRGTPPPPGQFRGGPGRFPAGRGPMPPFRGGPPGRRPRGPMRGGPREMGRMGRGFHDGGGRGLLFGRHPPPPPPPPPPPRRGSHEGRGLMMPPRPPPPLPPRRGSNGLAAPPYIPPPPVRTPQFGVATPPPINFNPQLQQQSFSPPLGGAAAGAMVPPGLHSSNSAQFPPHPLMVGPIATSVSADPRTSHLQQHHPLAVATSTPPTAQQIDQAWKEYTAPSGVKYYHNSLLNQSTYTKPAVMMQQESIGSAAVSSNSSSQKRTWQEYADASTGRKYYSDGVTTTWEKPEGFVSPDDIVAKTSLRDEATSEPIKKKKRVSETTTSDSVKNELISFGSKQEAVAAFKGLLLAKGVPPALKWNEVVKLCEGDSRWGARWEACSEVLSVGERRQALAEFQTKRANEIRNEERQERARAKETFGQMLAEVVPKISGFSSHASRFEDVRSTLAKDDRFFVIEDEGTRETLFLDFCDDFKKREERKKRSKKKEAQDSFVSFLQEKEEAGILTIASTWESFLSSLAETEKADVRFATSPILPDSDRQLYFADFVLDLQKAEDDKRRRIRDARRRAEKAQRDNFRAFLRTTAQEGRLFPYSRWRIVEELLSQHESFSSVQAQGRDIPRELFEEFADEWDERYRRERSFLARLIEQPDGSITIAKETTFDDFKNLLTKEASYSDDVQDEAFRIINREDPVSSAQLLYHELISRPTDSNRYGAASQIEAASSEDEGEIKEEDDDEVDDDGIAQSGAAISISQSASSLGDGLFIQEPGTIRSDSNVCDQKSSEQSIETGLSGKLMD